MRKYKRKKSSSRDDQIRKNNNKIEIGEKSQSLKKRNLKRMKEKKQIYIKRRRFLLFLLLLLVFFAYIFLSKSFNKYENYTYPTFRDEVRKSLANDVFVGDTSQRSLTSAEKLDDFSNLYKTISRNYAVSNDNRENFKIFLSSYNDYRNEIYKSKTDQEYFDIIISYLNLLDNSRVKIIDKKEYDDLLNYYKNHNDFEKSNLVQNPQVIDRYKRMLPNKKIYRKNTFDLIDKVLLIRLGQFSLSTMDEDIEIVKNLYSNSDDIDEIVIDLSDNSSVNNLYWQKMAGIFLHSDYVNSEIVFYRGNLIKNSLKEIKEKKEIYDTGFVQNPANKYPKEIDEIRLDDYTYYDEVTSTIISDTNFENKFISVVINDYTQNEAINFANVLRENAGAKIIKNSENYENISNPIINNFPVDFILLKHSGLLVTIDDGFSTKASNKFLEYDQYIDTNESENN